MQVKEDIARLARGTTTVASMSVASRNDCSLAASVSSHGAGVPMSNRIQPCPSSEDASLPTPPQEREGKQAKARGGVGVGVSPKSGKWAVRSSRGAAGAEQLGQGGRTDWCRDSLGQFVVENGLGRMVRANGGSEQGARKGLAETRREEARRKQRDGIAGSSRTSGFAEGEGDLFSKVQELMDRWAMSKFTKVLSPKIEVLYVPLIARNQASSRDHSTVVASTRRTCQGRPQGGPAERGGAGKNDPTTQF